MKCLVLEPFQTKRGEIPAGQVINLSKEAAVRLINEGEVEPLDRVAVKVYSRILDAYLWVVQDEADREALKASEGVSGAIYTADEVSMLHSQKPSPEVLRRVHEVKQLFPGSIVREVKRKGAA
ncbi:MAG: hypothetical protein M0Z48_08535 [Nitrospiraceae bacterium]|nr:hypothetical protein [Nitrospiraceae bacterium]